LCEPNFLRNRIENYPHCPSSGRFRDAVAPCIGQLEGKESMNTTLSSRRRQYITKVGFSLLILALVAGMTGCTAGSTDAVRYDLNIASTQGGSVDEPGEGTFNCDAGRVIDLSAIPDSGYRFVNWTGDVDTINNRNAASTAITVNGDYSITANFEQTAAPYYTLTMAVTGSGSTSPAVGQHSYNAGTVVSISANPASGYQFVGWSGDMGTIDNVNAASTTITMNDDHSIIANFEEIEGVYYILTMAVTGSGSTSPAVGQYTYTAGTAVPISASAGSGYYFSDWTAAAGSFTNASSATTTFTMPAQNVTVTAHFEVSVPYTLTMAVTGSGSTSPAVGQHTYTAGTAVPISASSGSGYQFVNWTGNVGTIANVSAASTTITMNGNYSITANFEESPPIPADEYSLTISSTAGGYVSTPGEGTFTRDAGTVVSLEASPYTGYQFVNWTGSVGTIANVNVESTTITMNGNYSITANFEVIPPVQYSLTISSTAGGSVTTPGEGTFTRNAGTVVNLVATPASGYKFVNWTGNVGTIVDVNSASTTITMNGNYSITANFEEIPEYELTVSSTAGGSVTNPGEGTFTYDAGTIVSLAATPSYGYAFVRWTGDIDNIADVNDAYTTIAINDNYSITANFEVGDWVFFPDPNLEAALREAIGKPTGRIYKSDLQKLTSFYAPYRSIIDLTGMEHCINLVSLDLHNNRISDISPLAGLTKLEWLDLSYNRISNISPLAGLTSLKWLYLYNNLISNISPVANLTNLKYLFLQTNQISNISPLANLTNLTRLLLFSNQISDISPLTNLAKLTWLYLQKNQISNISPLANLTNLTQLDLSHNQVTGISPLANLTNLTYLSLHSNQIVDISPLANLTDLMWLYLQNNDISNIYPLVDNDGLGTGDMVYLNGNPLSEDSRNIYIPELEARGVIVYFD
jgi:preprotein translocase subunit YajC